jgi:hypothetical protein
MRQHAGLNGNFLQKKVERGTQARCPITTIHCGKIVTEAILETICFHFDTNLTVIPVQSGRTSQAPWAIQQNWCSSGIKRDSNWCNAQHVTKNYRPTGATYVWFCAKT